MSGMQRRVAAGVVVCAVMFSLPALALPRVALRSNCPLVATYQTTAAALVDLLAETGEEPLDYTTADLETGLGDGVPDYYQLMLLAAALCYGDPGLNAQFAANRAAIEDYLQAVDDLMAWAEAARAHAATASQELDLFMAWPSYGSVVSEALRANVTMLADGLDAFLEATQFLAEPSPELDMLIDQRDELTDVLAGAAGLSTEMRATIQTAVEQGLAEVVAYQPQLAEMAGALDMAANLVGFLYTYNGRVELRDSLRALAGDLRAADALIDRLHFPSASIAIYGAEKTADEPFSGPGDYDKDRVTNAEVFTIMSNRGKGVADFVKAASGGDPFYLSENLPAAGMVGLAIMAAVIAFAGAFILFKRPRG